MMPLEVAQRVGKSKPKFSPYMRYEGRGLVKEVRCSLCNVPIVTLKEIVNRRVAPMPNAAFAEIEILFDDESKHVTSLCKGCIEGLTNDKLEAVYCGDMLQWEEDEKLGSSPMNWERVGLRKPVSFRRL